MNDKTDKLITQQLLGSGNVDIYGCRNLGRGENHFHWGKLFMFYFQETFSIYKVGCDYGIERKDYVDYLMSKYELSRNDVVRIDSIYNDPKLKDREFVTEAFLMLRQGLAVWVEPETVLVLYGNGIPLDEVKDIAKLTEQFRMKVMPPVKKFYMVSTDGDGFELHDFDVKEHDICLENNYNDDFPEIHEIIYSSLSMTHKNGLILLHGVYGSGKTYHIRHLISRIEKKFIYIPHYMIDWIGSPSFLPFLTKQQNAVLILEDCEDILMSRENNNTDYTAISNLLNMGDGLLSDALSLNIICSFNTNLKRIDDALLRKGRIIARYEFKKLEVPKAQKLADQLGKNLVVEEPMALAEIFNAEARKFENDRAQKVGFSYS